MLAAGAAWLYSPWMLPWSEVIDPVADQNGFAGERFSYCNSGYVMLALIAE